MMPIPNSTEWAKSRLVDASMNYGLSSSGTKSDIIARLHSHEIEKRVSSYNARKDKCVLWGRDQDGTDLLTGVHLIEEAMKKAAEEQHTADKRYMEKRLERVTNALEESERAASVFAETESSSIRRDIQVMRERRLARQAASPANRARNVRCFNNMAELGS
ncbi:hypothetical protein ACEPPN_017533 [Leptodophora sp. 'Broadleaf-Isolate-01']